MLTQRNVVFPPKTGPITLASTSVKRIIYPIFKAKSEGVILDSSLSHLHVHFYNFSYSLIPIW